jgi:wobble nucleotide-excising tRNase
MADDKIKTVIRCQNIAPIENLNREISSGSLKIGVFANNGSGKTFISRLFRLTENPNTLTLDEEGKSPTDKLLSFGKNKANFSFSVTDKKGVLKDDFKIEINKGEIPTIPKTKYLYHTFNQDYVEENIRALSYEKDSEIEGFILGKVNIDLTDDEAKIAKVLKDGKDLSEQIEREVNKYVSNNVSNIQNIKKLSEYKILEYQNIFKGVDQDKYTVTKSFDELISDYNKIKSVPENLEDIQQLDRVNINFELLNEVKRKSEEEFSLSSLADEFKKKIKDKQDFVESGMGLLENQEIKSVCPFCEQELKENAIALIDYYTKYLADTEVKTIKLFKNYIESLDKQLQFFKTIENNSNKRINEFNNYKTKYIPSSEGTELNTINCEILKTEIQQVIASITDKLKNISTPVTISQELIDEIEKNQTLLNKKIDENNKEIKNINLKKNRISEENKSIRREICRCAYNYLIDKHKTNIKNVERLREDWKKLDAEIRKKKEQQKVSKREKVASTIKNVLNYFFADKYTLDTETFRLVFHKNLLEKSQAKDVLSEGEKNIVAFAYYIGDTHLKIENEDDYKNLFFVIDDPISSMDFSHVYTLSGVIRDIGKIIDKIEKDRLIVFTHNNDFMRILASNNIVDKKLLLKNGELKDFNNNLTVPYLNHLIDIFNIARKGIIPTHTTANSIRHIIETLTKFESVDTSRESIAEYIKLKIPNDTKSYTLINDLSHGGWRSEQSPINEEDFVDVCETLIKHIEAEFNGQIKYCEKLYN